MSYFYQIISIFAAEHSVYFLNGSSFPFVRERIRDVRPNQYALATRADLRAADWIRQNLPPDSKFLVNSFFAYGDTLIVGSDGGWWLPSLTGRKTNLPPMPYATERGPFVGYAQLVMLNILMNYDGLSKQMVISLKRLLRN